MKKIKYIFFYFALSLFLISLVRADVIPAGYKQVPIYNQITNTNDYPDYVFISVGEGPMTGCNTEIIGPEGKIPDYYKFCRVSVYAIKKSDFSYSNENIEELKTMERTELESYLNSVNAKEVISNVYSSTQSPISSTQDSIVRNYEVDLEKTKDKPDGTTTDRNSLVYVYVLILIIGIVLLVFFLISKNQKKK